MSADCLFVVQHIADSSSILEALKKTASDFKCGIWNTPENALIVCNQIEICADSFLFEPVDSIGAISSELLLSPENYIVDGKKAEMALDNRLLFIQKLAYVSLMFSNSIDIYISEDNPYLPDYTIYKTTPDQVANILYAEYKKNEVPYKSIPSVWLHVNKGDKE
jgi:hypothetical protein